jgi:aspartate/methionine/tyrosine aminotransferase
MQIKPFRIEHYFAKHEFSARYLLASSDAESRSIQEVLDLEPGSHERFLKHWCGYTESPGAPSLRAIVAGIYQQIEPNQALIVSSSEEGILLVYHAWLKAGDHVIVETPCFESALELARSTGAEVSEWRRRSEDSWSHDVEGLTRLVRQNTRMIYICTPHNPTGLLMPRDVLTQVVELCRSLDIILFSDEVFRELEHDSSTRLPAACDLYENAVSLGSMSKTYGLPGLRLGWLVSRNASVLQRCLDLRLYTTICNSAPSEFVCEIALRHRDVLIRRNLEIVHRNLALLGDFFRDHSELFEWVKPNASPMCFPRFHGSVNVLQFCDDLVRESGVMLLPGTVYDQPHHIRFGYGRRNMSEALQRLKLHLSEHAAIRGKTIVNGESYRFHRD